MVVRFQTRTDLKPIIYVLFIILLRFTLGLQIKSERISLRRFTSFVLNTCFRDVSGICRSSCNVTLDI